MYDSTDSRIFSRLALAVFGENNHDKKLTFGICKIFISYPPAGADIVPKINQSPYPYGYTLSFKIKLLSTGSNKA
jgi:hypothetical protein